MGKRIQSIAGVILLIFAYWNLQYSSKNNGNDDDYDNNNNNDKSTEQEESAPEVYITIPNIVRNPAPKLSTLKEIKESMKLPCNYVHDGFYLEESNRVLNEVYLSLMEMINDNENNGNINDEDIIPVFIEVGGHDGITKSISLKSSICLHVNTLLIEASPTNYNVLKQTRAYDTTVHAALCDDEHVMIRENSQNSGENSLLRGADDTNDNNNEQQQRKLKNEKRNKNKATTSTSYTYAQVPCTSLDDELDAMVSSLPTDQQQGDKKIQLIFLVLDVEGFEPYAIQGLQKHKPLKVMMETKQHADNPEHKNTIDTWAIKHGLTDRKECGADTCFNFHFGGNQKTLLYGARKSVPKDTWKTSEVSKSYMYYGE